jgi:hypothetical protein
MITQEDYNKHFQDFFEKVRELVQNDTRKKLGYDLTYKKGRRYDKLIMLTGGRRTQRSVWGFVERSTGDILKAASWRAPAKILRGNIFDPDPMENMSWTGPAYMHDIIKKESPDS